MITFGLRGPFPNRSAIKIRPPAKIGPTDQKRQSKTTIRWMAGEEKEGEEEEKEKEEEEEEEERACEKFNEALKGL